uniref:Myc target 1b n=2 Tax=Takifugu rubripes TaxID=31033 RepID=A0A3B5K4D4_TAKRU
VLEDCVELTSVNVGIMAQNDTHLLMEILKSFNLGDMILAFCLSILVGLLLGALVYILLTWVSRRKASAMITRRSRKRSRTPQTNSPLGGQIGLYRSTFLNVYRQPSLEPVGPLGSKPNLETSTFRPASKRSRAPLDMGEDTQINMAEDTAASNASESESLVPNKRHSFWLGNNGLKGFLTSPTPPPGYDSVIHAFEETCT